jgi:hypothetical protein
MPDLPTEPVGLRLSTLNAAKRMIRSLQDIHGVDYGFAYVGGHMTDRPSTFSTGGYKVELRPAVPQGINPSIYILDKVVHKPTGPAPDVITHVPVRYTEKTNARYSEVEIRPDRAKVSVKEVQ